ncbi:trypsin-like peptidase domain-containing protein [Microvirga tunisiensis]|uniref:Serine protease n=1 Tax=Microvirga tunisiensis TaxID=2108360 RepID=A0A5N7MVK3_9HYPH|nr:trypsin-like peptidase domain-containing protein [Microvirga tunisiensis]MPR13148.1 hypothetical protein [Microvirga tunisiensis]MPR31015.1 hypothetical protein [Microvirga tunisiensis]
MLNVNSNRAPMRTTRWLGAVAVAALMAGGAVQTGLIAPNEAHAELRSMAQPVQGAPSFADVIERVKPAVVSIKVKVQNVASRDGDQDDPGLSSPDLPKGHPLQRFFRDGQQGPGQQQRQFGQSMGSGFFVSADGYVVTNNHVIENWSAVEITLDDGKTLDAKVIGTDPKTDLALLKVEGKDFPYERICGAPHIHDVLDNGAKFDLSQVDLRSRAQPGRSPGQHHRQPRCA